MKVTIWKTIKRNQPKWVVAYQLKEKRVRKFFDTKAEAELRRDELASAQDAWAEEWLLIPKEEQRGVLTARQDVLDAGYAGLRDFVSKHLHLPKPETRAPWSPKQIGKTVQEVLAEFYEAKTVVARSQSYLANLRSTRKYLQDAFGPIPIADITTSMVEAWLGRWSLKSRNTKITHAKAIFNFARKRKWCADNPADPIERARLPNNAPSVFTPADCERLLREAPRDLIGYLILCLFGGLRHSEALRITWDDIDFGEKMVRLPGDKTKVGDWRNVPLPDNALAWLQLASRKGKTVATSGSTIRRRRRKLLAILGIRWPRNVLRHTNGSTLAGLGKTTAEATDLMGNSPKVYRKHYRGRISRVQAEAYAQIYPVRLVSVSA